MSEMPRSVQGHHVGAFFAKVTTRLLSRLAWLVFWLVVLVVLNWQFALLWTYFVLWRDGGIRLH
jgi:hypothetical protein